MHATRSTFLLRATALAALTLSLTIAGCKSAPPPPDDNALNSAVQAKITGDQAISAEPVQSSVQGGIVTLQGVVSSEAAKALAANDAGQVAGVKSVVNQLTVETAAQTPPPAVAPPLPPPAPRVKPAPAPKRKAVNVPPPPPPAPIERHQPEPPPVQQAVQPPVPQQPAPPPPPAFRNVTIPAGSTLPVRITQTLDSATTQQGETFSGTIASDVLIDGLVAIPAGTSVSGTVDEVHEAGHFKGSSLLTISLTNINRRGEHLAITTDPFSKEGNGRGKNTVEKVGGGAAVGAILGGIFGGGKGAAIGSVAGGGLGAGANGVTRGQQVQIPSETLVRFHLTNSVAVRASTNPAGSGDANLQRHDSN